MRLTILAIECCQIC